MTSGLKLIMREWIETYPKKDQLDSCLQAYTGDSTEINARARDERLCSTGQLFKTLFADAPRLPYPMMVYRGLDQSYIQSFLTSGAPRIDRGFFSTSTCIEVSSEFAVGIVHDNCEIKDCAHCLNQSRQQPCLLRMVLPAGTPYFLPDYQDRKYDSGEKEIIVAPGALQQIYTVTEQMHPFAQRHQNLSAPDQKKMWTEKLVWIPIINAEVKLI